MAFKFCYENEIRRCSDPPRDFASLVPFVGNMFATRLPSEFNLSYISSEGQTIILDSEESYQNLLNNKSSKAVKIFINSNQPDLNQESQVNADQKNENQEYNILSQPESIREESVPKQAEIVPDVNGSKADQTEKIRRVVKEVLQEDMSYIISQVKDALMKEGLSFGQNQNKIDNKNEQGPGAYNWPAHSNPYYQAPYDFVNEGEQSQEVGANKDRPVNSGEKKPDFLGKMIGAIADLPNKATEVIGNFVEKFDGEVYVDCPEGRYSESVVERAGQLQEVFPDENKKELLDFVKGLPKNLELDEIADIFAHRKSTMNK